MDKAKRKFEVHFFTSGFDRIPSGIVRVEEPVSDSNGITKVKNRVSDFIALSGKLILSDPTVATGELLQEITKEIVREDVSRMKAVEELMMIRRVEEV